MDSQVRTAKAVVDIDEIHFLNHTNGEPEINDDLYQNDGWYSVATLKGSLEVTQDELSKTMIHIDQSTMPIGISTEPGDFNINFFMPDLKDENLKHWLHERTASKVSFGDYEGLGANFTDQLDSMTVLIISKTGEGFLFPNVQGAVTIDQEDKVWGLRYNGAVLGASKSSNKGVYFLNKKETTTSGNTGENTGD